MAGAFEALLQVGSEAAEFLAEVLYSLFGFVVYGLLNAAVGLFGEFINYLFGDVLTPIPTWAPPDWLIDWAEMVNNVVPLDQWLTWAAAYLALEAALFIYNWTLGFFWGAA